MAEDGIRQAKIAGGYLRNKLNIGFSRLTGDEVGRAVMKTTSFKVKSPNPKHLMRLIDASHGRMSASTREYHLKRDVCEHMVSELEKRLHTYSWIVVLKTMIVLHRLMLDGSPEVNRQLQRKKNMFATRCIKDVADDPTGAAQKVFIQAYIRYLEERNMTQALVEFDCRLEESSFDTAVSSIPTREVGPIINQMIQQLECVAEIELYEPAITNFATFEAMGMLIRDAKQLYAVLTNRLLSVLEEFHSLDRLAKHTWLAVLRRYHRCVGNLIHLFTRLRESNIKFDMDIPVLSKLPEHLITQLEENANEEGVDAEGTHSSQPPSTVTATTPTPTPASTAASVTTTSQGFSQGKMDVNREAPKVSSPTIFSASSVSDMSAKARQDASSAAPPSSLQASTDLFREPSGASAATVPPKTVVGNLDDLFPPSAQPVGTLAWYSLPTNPFTSSMPPPSTLSNSHVITPSCTFGEKVSKTEEKARFSPVSGGNDLDDLFGPRQQERKANPNQVW